LTRLRDPQTGFFGRQGGKFSAQNKDWIYLKQITTVP